MYDKFVTDNLPQLVVTLVGVFVGALLAVLIGLYLLRVELRHQVAKQQADLTERRKRLLDVLRRCVTFNAGQLKKLGERFKNELPLYTMDVATLDWLLLQQSGALTDTLVEQIVKLRLELSMVNRLVEMRMTVEYSTVNRTLPITRADGCLSLYERQHADLLKAMSENVTDSAKLCQELLAQLK
ncbi:MAG TPA: hypothetical protein VGP63_02665 [Planctomycetaceae bacterium]|jgi:hypothetical protein|nr:hypothetical protein [Planctomycetaceae bacterium]